MRINPGNQTDLHASWLFNLVDRPDLTQTYTRKIMNDFYGDTPKKGYGFSQDDDQGQLSAWFVLASIGLFDIQGGCSIDAKFQISTPLFDKIVIHLDKNFYSGQDFVIQVKRESINDYFISSAYLNGKVLKKLEIPQKNIIMGGNVILYLN